MVRPDGNRPTRRAVLVRFLVKYPVVAWLFVPPGMEIAESVVWIVQGAAWAAGGVAFFYPAGRTLSDLLARTRVVHRGAGDGVRVP